MKKINVTNWKNYKIADLFKIYNSKAYHMKDIMETKEGGLAYITRSKFNNGLKCYVERKDNYKINPANTISFGAENADFFYQDKEYITGNKMYYIDTSFLSKNSCLYLKTILQKTFTDNYSFSDGMIPAKIKDCYIKLPANSNGNPDWNYMDDYIETLYSKVNAHIKKIQKLNKIKNKKINIDKWKDFKIGDLFQIKRPTARSQLNYDNGDIPFVASGNINNGVLKYCVPKNNEVLDKGNCISVSPVDGSAFYQKKDFLGRGGAGSSIILLYNKNLNEYNGLFLCTIIRKKCSKYNYSNMGSKDTIAEETIKIPVKFNENPDWDYMTNYIYTLMK